MKERLRKAYNEKRLGLPQSDPSVPLFMNDEKEYDDYDHMMNEDESKITNSDSKPNQNTTDQNVIIGSALKRGPDGEFIIPIKKKKKKKIKRKHVNFLTYICM